MWQTLAASVAGARHRQTGQPCQDSHAVVALSGGIAWVVADGAGSAPAGGRGAQAVTQAVARFLGQLPEDPALTHTQLVDAYRYARGQLEILAENEGMPLAHLATTLALVVHAGGSTWALQVGDGLIAYRADGAGWQWVFWPQRGEFVNATHFVTDPESETYLQVTALPVGCLGLALLTDGLEPLALDYQTRAVVNGFFAPIEAALGATTTPAAQADLHAGLVEFLSGPRVRARTDDDVTLVLATLRREG